MDWTVFSEPWAQRALITSSMVGVMCGVLGTFVVLRNMSLIGDALSHAVLPGVVLGFMVVGVSAGSNLGIFAGAVMAGLFTAVAITWIQDKIKTKPDAAIGIVFTAMFSIGVVGISWLSKSEGVHLDLKDFLFGNVLGVNDSDMNLTAIVLVFVLSSIIILYRYLFATTFQPVVAEAMGISTRGIHYYLMLLLSFAVVASLQSVGVILVVAMLVTPAATALLLSNRLHWVLVIAAAFGLLSTITGFIASVMFETPPGPAMAIMATLFYLITVTLSPQKGLLSSWLRKRKQRQRIIREDVLKQVLKLDELNELSLDKLAHKMGHHQARVQKALSQLAQLGYVSLQGAQIKLTDEGLIQATRLVRAHRLWETYLVQHMGMASDQIHEDAERFEHLLTDDMLDEVEAHLGYPSIDPHGSPIPKRADQPLCPLARLQVGDKASIATDQLNEFVRAELWRLGLQPGATFLVQEKTKTYIIIELDNRNIEIGDTLCQKINVVQG
jgi:ABC-type Mn2+/Zn2+ transport system permease subunit/Mn-dependent DtxR family transcriptional regulator